MTHWLNGNRQAAFITITTVGDPYLEARWGGGRTHPDLEIMDGVCSGEIFLHPVGLALV